MQKEIRLLPPNKDSIDRLNHPYWKQRQRLAIFLAANQNKTEQDFFI